MKILVTGGTGFIGSCLVQSLVEDNHNVIVTGSKSEIVNNDVEYLDCHLNGIDYSRLGKIDICFHQAANNDTISIDRKEMFKANVEAPKELFQRLIQDHKCERIIYASSASVYGNSPTPFKEDGPVSPLSLYAESKLAFDEWVINQKFPAIGIRYTNVYGANEEHKKNRSSMVYRIVKNSLYNKTIDLFKYGEQKRNWVFVKDVVKINKLCMKSDLCGIINCGSENTVSFNDIVDITSKVLDKKIQINYIDFNFPFDFQKNTTVCLEKSKKYIKYKPDYSLEDGIRFVCSNLKK